ncbi:MAG: HindIII family type II restriction endonuclease [Oscillospiraceae bacterium]|nr:HindIII family type II restriction endonuclease [Oscillospiraceae bacterium]
MSGEFNRFIEYITKLSNDKKIDFKQATLEVKTHIDSITKQNVISIVKEIGIIPEAIEASSSLEKLYSKASDCLLARCFSEFGMPSIAVNERGNSADIIATSIHGYTLVADAKTFRLSRTAKNQKDFKISTLSNWRGSEHDFALLVAPYFQYPSISSQIYSSALDYQVCLLSWEHILFLLNNDVIENENFSLENIWNAPQRISRDKKTAYADRMNCQFPIIDKMVCDRITKDISDFKAHLNNCKIDICNRGKNELEYLSSVKTEIEKLTREEAILELLKSKKILERITIIEKFVNSM